MIPETLGAALAFIYTVNAMEVVDVALTMCRSLKGSAEIFMH